jgi:hypothetical protein
LGFTLLNEKKRISVCDKNIKSKLLAQSGANMKSRHYFGDEILFNKGYELFLFKKGVSI